MPLIMPFSQTTTQTTMPGTFMRTFDTPEICGDPECGRCRLLQEPEAAPEPALFTTQVLRPFGVQSNGRLPGWQRKARIDIPFLPSRTPHVTPHVIAVIGIQKLPPGSKAYIAQALNALRLSYTPICFATGPGRGTDEVVREFCAGYDLPVRQFGTDVERYEPRSFEMLNRAQLVLGFRTEDGSVPVPRGYVALRRRAQAAHIMFREYQLPCDDSTITDRA